MFILKEKGRGRLSSNFNIRETAYDTVRTRTVQPLHQINKVNSKTKSQRMVVITNIPGEYGGCRMNPYFSSGIYMTMVMESQ